MAEINPMVPVSALRAIAVEAIRSVTGCPDVSGNGKHLTDEIEAVARAAAESLRTTSQPVGVPEGFRDELVQVLNQARCLSSRTIGNEELASNIMALIAPQVTASPTPPAAQAKDEEAAFEAWVTAGGRAHQLKLDRHGMYEDLTVVAWLAGWMGRAALSAAPTAAGDEAKPMTEDELNSVWQASISDVNNRDFKTLFARAIERHHGIVASAEAGKVGG